MTEKRRRRRLVSEDAKAGILDAAAAILAEGNPSDLKFQSIAKQAGISKANIGYHFGTISEVRRALLNRSLSMISSHVAQALFETVNETERPRIEAAVEAVYDVMLTQQSVKSLAWLILSADDEHHDDFARQLKLAETLIVYNLPKAIAESEARDIASMVVYQVVVVSLGDALFGNLVRDALGYQAGRVDAKQMLVDHIASRIERRPGPARA